MPTALDLTREQWQPYIEAARRRPAPPELTPEEQRQRDQLLARVREAAAVLKARFGAGRVVLFGSLAHGAWFTPTCAHRATREGVAILQARWLGSGANPGAEPILYSPGSRL